MESPDADLTTKRRVLCERRSLFFATRAAPSVKILTVGDAAALHKSELILVDVRSYGERSVGMIPGALTLRQFEARFPDAQAFLAADESHKPRTIVAPYCTIGFRSGKYAARLIAQGFPPERVRNHQGVLRHSYLRQPLSVPGPTGELEPGGGPREPARRAEASQYERSATVAKETDVGSDGSNGGEGPTHTGSGLSCVVTPDAEAPGGVGWGGPANTKPRLRVHVYAAPWRGLADPTWEEVMFGPCDLVRASFFGCGPAAS